MGQGVVPRLWPLVALIFQALVGLVLRALNLTTEVFYRVVFLLKSLEFATWPLNADVEDPDVEAWMPYESIQACQMMEELLGQVMAKLWKLKFMKNQALELHSPLPKSFKVCKERALENGKTDCLIYAASWELRTSKWKPTSQPCENSLMLRSDFAALLGVCEISQTPFSLAKCQPNSKDFSSEDERLGSLSLGVRKTGIANTGKLLDSKETSISYLLRAFEGKSKVKDHLEWQVLGERYEPLQGASVINFVDYSLNQGAPAGHESAETPIGHESNGAVAGDRTPNQMEGPDEGDLDDNACHVSLQDVTRVTARCVTRSLQDGHVFSDVPQFLASFSNLSHLQLSSCGLTGTFPEKIIQVTTLQILDLSMNLLEDSLPEFPQNGSLETLVLSDTKLWGKLPNSMGNLKKLTSIELARCHFSGPILNSVANLPQLIYLDLSENKLSVQCNYRKSPPVPVFPPILADVTTRQQPNFCFLDLSSNKFNGNIELSKFKKLGNLTDLSLSYNNLSINATLFKLDTFRPFPIHGNIPSWIWKIGNGYLVYLNLSHNLLEDLHEAFSTFTPYLSILDLHSNQLHGQIPTPPIFCSYMDYSNNSFTSSIPEDIGTYIFFTIFFSLSKNNITRIIPAPICNANYLRVLDFSDNALSGMIPSCLIGNEILEVLNLRRNKFSATIPGEFSGNCLLRTLDLNGNLLEGKIPESLANCKELEVLNLGNNQMSDFFPCLLKTISSLRVLVLRSNRFYRPIQCRPYSNPTWPLLQIIDLASNNFSGDLSRKFFLTWKAMRADKDGARSELNHLQLQVLQFSQVYYQDTVTVTSKGLEMQLVKILTVFTAIDFSFNNFQGRYQKLWEA
ncbi:Receptor-like protein 12 [Vitis vinifera]|uniref:Receptor-like protein 12 n=1 Tax=Vitis vinifera TaxID=29760 RepID=A0A438BRT3_VITVI|nr:Receptor-like protein 12 [Vitis vinifera]